MRKIFILSIMLFALLANSQDNFKHTLGQGKKPWTHEKFNASKGKFSFAIIPDRTGSERPGVFEQAIEFIAMAMTFLDMFSTVCFISLAAFLKNTFVCS